MRASGGTALATAPGRARLPASSALERHWQAVGQESLTFAVARNVAIVGAGETVGFEQLSANPAIRLLFEDANDDRRLVRIKLGS